MNLRPKIVNLRPKIVGLIAVLCVVVLAISWGVFNWLRDDIVTTLSSTYAEKQVLYNRERALHPVMRELALAQKLADSSTIRAWARDEDDSELRAAGLQELEDYRRAFADKSYFFVIGSSLNYYFNDHENSYAGEELRYTLDPANPDDRWYFATSESDESYKLNVNYDAELQVTKVWMNVVVRDDRTVLGMLGTGIDLSAFLKEVVSSDQEGVTNMFVDEAGALQAHDRVDLIDFHSISKDSSEQRTIFRLLDSEADRQVLQVAMDRLRAGDDGKVGTVFVHSDGNRYLVGLSYLDEIGWFSVTLMDTSRMVGSSRFLPFALLIFVALFAFSVALVFALNGLLLRRVHRLDGRVRDFAQGTPLAPPPAKRSDEIGRLEEGFQLMARSVHESTAELESKVTLRTQELKEKNEGLLQAMEEIKALSGLLPVCMYCKKIRDDYSGKWTPMEQYISHRSEAQFSHGMCPECEAKFRADTAPQGEPEKT